MRTDNQSSLDFMYWILDAVEENYTTVDAIWYPYHDENNTMRGTIVNCALICGVEIPRGFDALLAQAARYDTLTSPEKALRTRGGILHRNRALVVSCGDGERLVDADVDGTVSLYQAAAEQKDAAYWDGALLLPQMRYL
jgi:hypothetical protein